MKEIDKIRVEVVFGVPERQSLVVVSIDANARCTDVIAASGIATLYPDSAIADLPIAIWGRPAKRGDAIKHGDRIELLRPLQMDPRDARRQLAIEGRFMGGSLNSEDA